MIIRTSKPHVIIIAGPNGAGKSTIATLIVDAMSKGVRQAIRRHKQAGVPIATWQDNQVVIVPAEEIEIKDE